MDQPPLEQAPRENTESQTSLAAQQVKEIEVFENSGDLDDDQIAQQLMANGDGGIENGHSMPNGVKDKSPLHEVDLKINKNEEVE